MYSKQLRTTLSDVAKKHASTYKYKFKTGLKKTPESALIFDQTEYNFSKELWAIITNKHNTDYFLRTPKVHSSLESSRHTLG